MLRVFASLIACLGIVASPEDAVGADRVPGPWYGSGVHKYFSGDYLEAHETLSRAIDAGTKDPRCYYFRAMAALKLGRDDEALADMKAGAKLENQDSDRFYGVNRSLERVQGRHRLTLEKIRQQARTTAYEAEKARSERRYEQLRRNERDVLRRRVKIPIESLSPLSKLADIVEEDPTVESKTSEPVASTREPTIEPTVDGDSVDGDSINRDSAQVGEKMKAGTLVRVLLRVMGGEGALNTRRNIQQAAIKAAESMQGSGPAGEDDPFEDDEPAVEEGDPFGDDEPATEDDLFGDG